MRSERADSEEGASVVEFALVLPVLLMVVFGIVEFGRLYSQYQVYQGAAREGARFAAVRPTTGPGPDAAAVRLRVIDAAQPYEANISPASINVSTQCSSSNTGTVVRVTWTQPATIAIPLLPSWNVNLPIKSAFRCE